MDPNTMTSRAAPKKTTIPPPVVADAVAIANTDATPSTRTPERAAFLTICSWRLRASTLPKTAVAAHAPANGATLRPGGDHGRHQVRIHSAVIEASHARRACRTDAGHDSWDSTQAAPSHRQRPSGVVKVGEAASPTSLPGAAVESGGVRPCQGRKQVRREFIV